MNRIFGDTNNVKKTTYRFLNTNKDAWVDTYDNLLPYAKVGLRSKSEFIHSNDVVCELKKKPSRGKDMKLMINQKVGEFRYRQGNAVGLNRNYHDFK